MNQSRQIVLLLFSLLLSGSQLLTAAQHAPIWQDTPESALLSERIDPQIVTQSARHLTADITALRQVLASAPQERVGQPLPETTIVTLPLPDGAYGRFRIANSPVMHPALAERYPNITTYIGEGVDDPTASARLDWTPHGFHAIIFTAQGTIYIDPYSADSMQHYVSYWKRNAATDHAPQELPPLRLPEQRTPLEVQAGGPLSAGSDLRTYRLAVATTGEYTAYHGGTVELGLAAVVTAVNRVTGIFEKEVAVRLQLVANNDSIIYTNGATDPYSNFDGIAMLAQNQTTLDSVIGSANYDVGHVFSTGGGGVAYVGVICNASYKAQGVTGRPAPIGDPFYVDYVSHELGHQFNGTHTFNSTAGSCGWGNREAATAYEPGSGTTIMAYAGICEPHNIQSNSDDFFHTANFDQIRTHVQFGSGATCGSLTLTGNTPPTANAGSTLYTIPVDTPFTLTGSGVDLDGESLTYSWEQFDLGASGAPTNPSGNAPLFRSFPPALSPARTFPQPSDIVNNASTMGEILPGYGRSMTFRLTVRDNQTGGGGVAYDAISVDVSDSAGPFLVTAPNSGGAYIAESAIPVTWDVANTNAAPVNCDAVDIALSIDGGYTYPFSLSSGTANDGSETVTLPDVNASTARIMVSCTDNIFFDISNADFTVTDGSAQESTTVYLPLIREPQVP